MADSIFSGPATVSTAARAAGAKFDAAAEAWGFSEIRGIRPTSMNVKTYPNSDLLSTARLRVGQLRRAAAPPDLPQLRSRLAQMRLTYSDNYPEVRNLEAQIAKLEGQRLVTSDFIPGFRVQIADLFENL